MAASEFGILAKRFRKLTGAVAFAEATAPLFQVGDRVVSASSAGIDSNKEGRVLEIKDGWAQIQTSSETIWLPNSKLFPIQTESKSKKVAPFKVDLQAQATANDAFRRVVFTSEMSQIAVMSIPVEGEVGTETHDAVEQTFMLVAGEALALVGGQELLLQTGEVLVVPAQTEHNIFNIGKTALKLVTTYIPPQHPPDTVHLTKADSDAAGD